MFYSTQPITHVGASSQYDPLPENLHNILRFGKKWSDTITQTKTLARLNKSAELERLPLNLVFILLHMSPSNRHITLNLPNLKLCHRNIEELKGV